MSSLGELLPGAGADTPDDRQPRVQRSQFVLVRRRFVRHRLAVASLVVLIVILIVAANASFFAPHGYDEIDISNIAQAPTFENSHFFGTDQLGRDYFSRVLYATRTSAVVALVVALTATTIGTVIGALAGFYRGWIDALLMRVTDLVMVLPGLAVLMILVSFVGKGSPLRVALILACLFWTLIARIVRADVLSLREREFVQAARLSGASSTRLIVRHLLPNAIGPIIVNATLTVATAVIVESALSYLGIGVQPPNPALGQLIAEGRGTMLTHWWLVTMPGIVLVVLCLAVNFVGDGLRDAFDSTARERPV